MVKIFLDFRNVILYKYCYFKLWLLKKNNNKFSRTFCVNPCSGEIVLWWYLYGVPWWLQLSKFLLSTTNLYGHKYQCFTILPQPQSSDTRSRTWIVLRDRDENGVLVSAISSPCPWLLAYIRYFMVQNICIKSKHNGNT